MLFINTGVQGIQFAAVAARAYQLNAQMITLQDQTMGRMLNLVASG